MQGETSKAYIKGFTRRDYIQKVHELIERDGIRNVSIRKIAREMDCSSACLYRHFSSLSELLYYAELRTLTSYLNLLAEKEKTWSNIWEMHVGVWDCYSREAFVHPEAFNLLFFENDNINMQESIEEYYSMFPQDLNEESHFFHEMLQTSDFFARDFTMCRKCIQAGAISIDNAFRMNRLVCHLFKGYFKTVLDEGIRPEEINGRVEMFINDVDIIVRALASDLKGYQGYNEYRSRMKAKEEGR